VNARLVLIPCLLAIAAPARAGSAEAETLFREGRRLLKQGEVAAACDKFEASDRLEPTAGTELNLADCREKNGQLATAWAMFIKAATTAKHSDTDGKRAAEARRRAAALEPRLVHLKVVVSDDAKVDGLVIKRNGEVVDPELWNQKDPVDPGSYEITADAPGYDGFQASVVVKGHDRKVEIPTLTKTEPVAEPPAKPTEKPPATHGAETARDMEPPPPEPPPTGMTGKRKAALVIGILGVASFGAAAGTGFYARSLEQTSDKLCPTSPCNNITGVDDNTKARNFGLATDIELGVGGAAVITATVLWLTGGRHAVEHVSITPRGDGATVLFGGSF